MSISSLRQLLRRATRPSPRDGRRGHTKHRPQLEILEDRSLLDAVSWSCACSGNWGTPANWSTGRVPTAADDVTINAPGFTITQGIGSDVRTLNFSSGTLTGGGTLTVSGLFTWTGGTITGLGRTVANGGLDMSTGGGKTLGASRTLENRGLAVLGGSAPAGANSWLSLDASAQFQNHPGAVFEIRNNQGLFGTGSFENVRVLVQAGVLRRTVSTGTAVFQPFLRNHGTVNVLTGTLNLTGGSFHQGRLDLIRSAASLTGAAGAVVQLAGGLTHRFDFATAVAGALRVELNGDVVFGAGPALPALECVIDTNGSMLVNGGAVSFNLGANVFNLGGGLTVNDGVTNLDTRRRITVPSLTMTGGTLTGPDALTINGPFTWNAGILSGPGEVIVNGDLDMTAAGARTLGRNLYSHGTATLGGTDPLGPNSWLEIRQGAHFANRSAFHIRETLGLFGSTFVNDPGAVVRRTGSSRVVTFQPFLSNSGLVDIQGGGLALGLGSTHTSSARVTGAAGTLLQISGGIHDFVAGSQISIPQFHVTNGEVHVRGAYAVSGSTRLSAGSLTLHPTATVTNVGATLDVTGGTATFNSGEALTIPTLILSGGIVTGSDNLTVTLAFTWSGGTLDGTGIAEIRSGVDMRTGGSKFLGRTLHSRAPCPPSRNPCPSSRIN